MSNAGRHESVDRFYSRWAGLYDQVARRTPGIGSVRRRTVDSLALDPGDTVVEMGCGTGANVPYLHEAIGPKGTVLGIDLATGVLRRAADQARYRSAENAHFVRADATRPPFETADAILATFLVGMLADPEEAVETWLDHLAPGGRIALLNATRSGRPAMAPLDLAFRGFVRLAAPGNRTRLDSPALALESRVADAHAILLERCDDVRRESLAGGYLSLISARRPA